MEESISGFRETGGWVDMVEHGERITEALREAGAEGRAFEEWEEWRPKSHERLGEEVSEKTAKQASVAEGEGEREGQSPGRDVQEAGNRLAESYEELAHSPDPDEATERAIEKWQDSIDHATRAADSAGRKALRAVEETVYRRVMTQIAPYYFDNELVSANIQRIGHGDAEERFAFEINVNDDDLKAAVSQRLTEFEDEIDRWHVETEKNTENFEAAEGAESPE